MLLPWRPILASKLEAFLEEMAALEREGAHLLVVPAEGVPLTVSVSELLYATSEQKGLRLVLAGGREILTRPSESMASLGGRLAAHPNIARCHNSYLVNLDQVQRLWPVGKGEYRMELYSGQEVPLTMGFGPVMGYFGIGSLDHVVPWNERQAAIIKEHLHLYEKDIRFMSDEEIRGYFSYQSTGELVTSWVIGNIIWQAYNWIQEGKMDKLDGNIRSFWYSHIKPVLARFMKVGKDQYDTLTAVLSHYVGDCHFFRYSDMGFVDDSGSTGVVGDSLPAIIFFAEKQGHLRALQQIAAEKGVTIIALGGQPSLLTTEGLADALMAKQVDLNQRFYLLTDVDYDPSGNIIAEAFRHQLLQMGVEETLRFDLIQPESFTPTEVKYFKFPVPQDTKSDIKKTRLWMDKSKSPFGGGLPGDDGHPAPYGLESDAMERKRLLAFARAAIDELAKAQPDESWEAIAARIRQSRPPIVSALAPLERLG